MDRPTTEEQTGDVTIRLSRDQAERVLRVFQGNATALRTQEQGAQRSGVLPLAEAYGLAADLADEIVTLLQAQLGLDGMGGK